MSVGTATALLGAGALASAFGGSKKQTTQQQSSGFQALPQSVQDLLLQQYLPKAQATLNMPYQAIPMQRATNPATDPFASKALWDLQNFSDAAGGYFTPYNNPSRVTTTTPVNMSAYQGAAGNVSSQGGNAQPTTMNNMGDTISNGLKVIGISNNQSGRPFVSLNDGRMIPLNSFNNPNVITPGVNINPQTLQLMG